MFTKSTVEQRSVHERGFRSRYDDAKYCIFADDNMKFPTVISTVSLLVF
jgi:hypothetical protein